MGITVQKLLAVIFSISFIFMTGCNSITTGYNVKQTNMELTVMIDSMTDFELNNITKSFKERYPNIKLINLYPSFEASQKTSQQQYEDFFKKVSAEIMAGKGPDIIAVGKSAPFFKDINKSIKTGVFYDINLLLKDNKNYNRKNYIEAAMKAGEYKGGQYFFPMTIDAPMLVTTQEIIDDTGINLDNCKDYFGLMNELDKYHKLVGEQNKRSSFAPLLFDNLELLNAYDSEVDFYRDEVKQTLQIYKECEENSNMHPISSGIEDSHIGLFNLNKIVFSDRFFGFESLMLSTYLNEKFKPIILPKYNSKGQIQTTISSGLVVNSNSPNLDNAAKFFDVLLTNHQEINILDDAKYKDDGRYDNVSQEARYIYTILRNSIPTNKSYIKKELTLLEKKYNDGYDYNIYDIKESREITPLSNEYYKQFEDICNSIEVCTLPTTVIWDVYNFFQPYFKDEKSLDECIQIAQSTMEIYVSE